MRNTGSLCGTDASWQADEPFMVPLHVKDPLFLFRIGKGRGIDKNQIIGSAILGKPLQTVSFDQVVCDNIKTIQGKIHPRPLQIILR